MLPNILSFLRILLVIPLIYVMQLNELPNQRIIAFGILLLGALTDKLDGYFARKFHQSSQVGIIIDPIADKIGVGILIVILWLWNNIETWFLLIIVGRDLLILIGGFYLKQKHQIIVASNTTGKITLFFISVALGISLLNFNELVLLKEIFIWIAVIYCFYSFYLYAKNFIEIVSRKNENIFNK